MFAASPRAWATANHVRLAPDRSLSFEDVRASPWAAPARACWRLLPMRVRRNMLDRMAVMSAPRPDRHPPPAQWGIAVAGEISLPTGLGESARLMFAALTEAGLGLCRFDTEPGSRMPATSAVLPLGAPVVVHANPPGLAAGLARLPSGVLRRRRVIGYWAWELPVVPDSWRAATRLVHEVWVPSRFAAAAIASILPADGSIPLRVVPHPVATVTPRPAAMDRQTFGLLADPVIILVSVNLASRSLRKNPLGAIAAFRQAFGDRRDRLLVLKLGSVATHPDDFAQIRAAVAGAANIRIETRTFTCAEHHALIACADIVLSLHRSEGFGLVPAEAMLLGRPVVATGWSGNMDFMDDGSAALVPFRLVAPVDPSGLFDVPNARWAEPDLGAAARHLARLADDRSARESLGTAGRAMAERCLGAEKLLAAVRTLGLQPHAASAPVATGPVLPPMPLRWPTRAVSA